MQSKTGVVTSSCLVFNPKSSVFLMVRKKYFAYDALSREKVTNVIFATP